MAKSKHVGRTALCRVLRGTHGMIGAGKNEKGEERRFMLVEFHKMPEDGDWEYEDEVRVELLSAKGRKK